ncbi:MAG: hypothetical protein MUF62_00890 [Chitinophagaceae bacterium]|jgi:hypothetical protein|nr:hypothetical protein [Chitinophagaceae bacterium]
MKIPCILVLLLVLATSCRQGPQAPQPAGTPAALQAPSSSLTKRYSGSGNLVDEIYDELAEADTALQATDRSIRRALAACRDTLAVYQLYQEKTSEWLNAARLEIKAIGDSSMRQQWQQRLAVFEQAQLQRTAALQQQVDVATQLKQQLNDYYRALKLQVSMKSIERYQQQALPPVSGVQAVQKQLQQALEALRRTSAGK